MRLSDPERTLFHDICFNPRTHTGCDDGWFATDTGGRVSIHAPTRGATAMGCKNPSGISVSIHAPTRGATSGGVQPLYLFRVSIHAPTRGATSWIMRLRWIIGSFNPRTHTGCDAGLIRPMCLMIWFQSTHPHGVRRVLNGTSPYVSGFNPRTHTGCDTHIISHFLCL